MSLFTDQLDSHIEVMQSVQALAAVVEQVAQRWIQTLHASGNSANICNAINVAKKIGCYCVALTGATGGKLASLVDSCICVPSTETPRIQEAHAFIGHMLCEYVDRAFAVTAD